MHCAKWPQAERRRDRSRTGAVQLNGGAQRFHEDLTLLVVANDACDSGDGEESEQGDGDGKRCEILHGQILVK